MAYHIAAHQLAWDRPVPELAAFGAQEDALLSRRPLPRGACRPLDSAPVYQGPGWIGNCWREVACWSSPTAGFRLSVAGAGLFSVAADGTRIQVKADPGATASLVTETVLGPALILALALQGTWCLHASAVTSGNRVVAFVAETGGGKSTLAAFLGIEEGDVWRHIADDVLPVVPHSEGLDALPHFPQLKLPPDQQPSIGLPERLSLAAIYLLGQHRAGQNDIEIHSLTARRALLTLVRHTVAARLFDQELLARHLTFCAQAAAHVPVRELVYPRHLRLLPRVRDALATDLERL